MTMREADIDRFQSLLTAKLTAPPVASEEAFTMFTRNTCLGTIFGIAALAAASVRADDLIWNQTGSPVAAAQPSSDFVSSWESWDVEVADDFDLVGTVTRVRAIGASGGFSSPGAWVRFYDVAPDGKPGALLREHFFSSGDPNLLLNEWTIDAVLPTPLEVDSRIYVSVQQLLNGGSSNPTTSSYWRWNGTLNGYPNGQPSYIRNPAGGWGSVCSAWCSTNADRIFLLYGSLSKPPPPPPPPVIDGLSDATVPRNGRVKISGSNFTASVNNEEGWPMRKVLVNGQPTARAKWTGTEIHAYILGEAPLGPATIQVQTEGGTSAAAMIEIAPTPPPPGGRIKWRFMADHPNMFNRSAIATDGTVYCSDGGGNLYAISAAGDLKWIYNMIDGGASQSGNEGPVAIDQDGFIYVAGDPLGPDMKVYSLNPDGTLRWVFTDTNTQGVIAGPNVGPDGNVYVATDQGGLGLFALTPEGQLLWSNTGDPVMAEHGQTGAEIVFGPLSSNGEVERVYVAFDQNVEYDRLFSFTLTGQQQFSVISGGVDDPFQGQIQPAIGPDGSIYLCDFGPEGGMGWRLKSFHPLTGEVNWTTFDPGANVLTNPDVGSDGVVYVARDFAHLHAFNSDGSQLWQRSDTNIYDAPKVSPDGSIVLFGGVPDFGMPGFMQAVNAASGQTLWQVDLPMENNGNIVPTSRAMFSADGKRAYFSASYLSPQPQDEYSYLYALDSSAVGNPIPADITGDGFVDINDLLAVIGAWGPCPPPPANCPADVEPAGGNGVVDINDLLLVISNWG